MWQLLSCLALLLPSDEIAFLSQTSLFRPDLPTFLPTEQVADLQIVTDLESLANFTVEFAVC